MGSHHHAGVQDARQALDGHYLDRLTRIRRAGMA
jgi:hypothetical protein